MTRTPLLATAAGFGVLLTLVVTDWAPLRRLDLAVARNLNDVTAPHPSLAMTWRAVSEVGQPATFQVLAVLAGLVLWRRGQAVRGLVVALTVVLTGLLSNLVKWSVRRERPSVPDPLAHAAGTSFPSGHAMSSLVGTAMLLLVVLPWLPRLHRRLVVAAGAVVVVAIGYSRLALGVHYLSDVVAGWLLGATWVLLATGLLARLNRARPTPSPASPDRLPGTPIG